MINQLEKQFSNYNPNLKGKGVKIAVLEYYASNLFYNLNVSNKLNAMCGGDGQIFQSDPGENHPYKCCAIWRDGLPEATIDFFPQNNDGLKAAIAGNYDIVSFSGGNCFADDELEIELSKKSFIMIAGGNDADKGEGYESKYMPVRQEYWYAVGAAHLGQNGIPEMAPYSSFGNGVIKMVSFSNIQYKEGSPKIQGTSFSTPFSGILLGQFTQAFFNRFGTRPTPKEYINFISRNTYSITEGTLKDGQGILILPNFDNYDFGIEVKAGSKNASVNGVVKEMVAPAISFKKDTPIVPTPDMVDRLYFPVTALRDLGYSVEYHANKKSVIICPPPVTKK